MNDRDFLCWIHERLEHVHGESPLVDYMHRLRAIIATQPLGFRSHHRGTNSLDELVADLNRKKDGAESSIIRMGPEAALSIGLRAIADHLERAPR